jgi:DNA helicase-2/ATP-dependent DNA helicase PcrA
VITLDRNYRSTAAILDASNAVIAQAHERFAKELTTDRGSGERPRLVTVADEIAQAQFVATEVLRHRENGIALHEQAVLFRASGHSAQLELELGRRNIPFVKFGGLRFLEAAHVKDVLSILRWIDNPRGRLAGFRTLRLLPGVGPATATRWLDALDDAAAPLVALAGIRGTCGCRRRLASAGRALRSVARGGQRLAGGNGCAARLVRTAARADL